MESRVGWRCLGRPIRNGYARPKGDAVRFALTTHLVLSGTENELRPIRSGANTFFFFGSYKNTDRDQPQNREQRPFARFAKKLPTLIGFRLTCGRHLKSSELSKFNSRYR